MIYEDLLGVPYKTHGRDAKNGFDCYGLVIECARRNGTPIPDLWYDKPEMTIEVAETYIERGLNLQKIDGPETGCVVEMEYNGMLHAGFMVDPFNVIHTTGRGVKLTQTRALKILAYYKITRQEERT